MSSNTDLDDRESLDSLKDDLNENNNNKNSEIDSDQESEESDFELDDLEQKIDVKNNDTMEERENDHVSFCLMIIHIYIYSFRFFLLSFIEFQLHQAIYNFSDYFKSKNLHSEINHINFELTDWQMIVCSFFISIVNFYKRN